MYESHFLLSHRPFRPAPNAEAYIPTGSLEQARQTLIRCIDRAEGPGLVIGPAGGDSAVDERGSRWANASAASAGRRHGAGRTADEPEAGIVSSADCGAVLFAVAAA